MGRKPKPGTPVTHKSGAKGKISATQSGGNMSWVKFDGAKKSVPVWSSSLSKQSKGCLVWMAVPLIMIGAVVYGYSPSA